MDFKNVIFVTDLDGTLLTDDKRLLDCDLKAIERFRAGGGIIAAATGRGIAMAKRVVEMITDVPSVIFNGAAVYDFSRNEFLWRCEIAKRAYDYVDIIARAFPNIGAEVLCERAIYVPYLNEVEKTHLDWEQIKPEYLGVSEIPKSGWLKFLFSGEPELIDKVERFIEAGDFGGVHWIRSGPLFYECLPEGVDKWSGFQHLIKLLHDEERFTVAAGDYNNDTAMIKNADLGCAPINALESVRDAADLVVCDNNSGAISEIIDYIGKI
ncbi:MAG: HAD family phosphatase [Oscillospiraceae bacterium]|nr:HAD family phosphatase [Oscillospiraceae bacterium]